MRELSCAKSINILFSLSASVDWLIVKKTVSHVNQPEFYSNIVVLMHVLCYCIFFLLL